jgi:hypothetical protein
MAVYFPGDGNPVAVQRRLHRLPRRLLRRLAAISAHDLAAPQFAQLLYGGRKSGH